MKRKAYVVECDYCFKTMGYMVRALHDRRWYFVPLPDADAYRLGYIVEDAAHYCRNCWAVVKGWPDLDNAA